MTHLEELTAERIRWAGLAGRAHGNPDRTAGAFVLLHGLTFDRHMWDPVLDALPEDRRAIAFDLPGHGGSRALDRPGLEPAVDAIHEAVLDAGVEAPIVVGHSIGGPLATIYAATHEASGVVVVDAPLRFEPFAAQLRAHREQLSGDDFDAVWEPYRRSMRLDLLTAGQRRLLRAGDHASRDVVLGYQHDLLEVPLDEVLRRRSEGLEALRRKGTPYLALHAKPVDPAESAFVNEGLPQAELVVWPVWHHFPHVAAPDRFAVLLTQFAATACA